MYHFPQNDEHQGIVLNLRFRTTLTTFYILVLRQHNGQKKKYKRTNNGLQNIHIKLKLE
jgi:hypothetical protein